MSKVRESGNLGDLIDNMPELASVIVHIKEGLDKLLKDVRFWLDNLRISFPRLYFIDDDELLDLLSLGRDFESFKRHLPKLVHSSF
jgi:hypothetical protein